MGQKYRIIKKFSPFPEKSYPQSNSLPFFNNWVIFVSSSQSRSHLRGDYRTLHRIDKHPRINTLFRIAQIDAL